MNFKNIFDKEFLVEAKHVRKGQLQIGYKIRLKLLKADASEGEQENIQTAPTEISQSQPQMQQPEQQIQQPTQMTNQNQVPNQQVSPIQEPESNPQSSGSDMSSLLASTQTEEDMAAGNYENAIIRHFEGQFGLTTEQNDNIESVQSIVNTLKHHQKNDSDVLDDFSAEIIMICANQQFDQLEQKIDKKKSKIYVDLWYGYDVTDSVGIRFNKEEGSDQITSTMLFDNKTYHYKFNINMINQRIMEYRNYEVDKKN